jgi:hypothetical protein
MQKHKKSFFFFFFFFLKKKINASLKKKKKKKKMIDIGLQKTKMAYTGLPQFGSRIAGLIKMTSVI